MQHFFRDVPRLGNVAVSRHAQKRLHEEGITEEQFRKVLLQPIRPDVPDGQDVIFRERNGIRLVILLNPQPNRGAKLVKTLYLIGEKAKIRR